MKLSGAIWACLTAFGVVDFVAASDSDHPKFKDQWSALKYADKLNRGVRPGVSSEPTPRRLKCMIDLRARRREGSKIKRLSRRRGNDDGEEKN